MASLSCMRAARNASNLGSVSFNDVRLLQLDGPGLQQLQGGEHHAPPARERLHMHARVLIPYGPMLFLIPFGPMLLF